MKALFYTKTFIALAVAVAAAAAAVGQAQEQPIPPPASDSAMPANIVPGSPLADVVKMLRAGVDINTLQSYVANSQSAFNLDADEIIFLKDEGAPSELINAMMDRDKVLYASSMAPPPQPAQPAPAPAVVQSAPDTAPPPAEVTVNYFYDSLSPYGSWVDVDGYGRCWRPTAVTYNSAWRPYCDRGHWVYTDCGWYWDSDYSWGIAFHYGRWFHHARFGWCWYPDTVWAPSWVAWRSSDDYCGWAPLPPFAVFRPEGGFFYRGVSVGVNFDFGLGVDCFTFVAPGHFCDRQPARFVLAQMQAAAAFQRAAMVNNAMIIRNQMLVNRGIELALITRAAHRNIEPVQIKSLPNAARQGWRGEGFEKSFQHGSGNSFGNNSGNGNLQLRHGPELKSDSHGLGLKKDNFSENSHGPSASSGNGQSIQLNRGPASHPELNNNITKFNNPGNGQPLNQTGSGLKPLSKTEPLHLDNQVHPQTGGNFTPQNGIHDLPQTKSHQIEAYKFNNNGGSPGSSSGIGGASSGFNASQNSFKTESVQNRNFETRSFGPTGGGNTQHGAAQLQQNPFVAPAQPHVDSKPVFSDSARSYTPPPSVSPRSYTPPPGVSAAAQSQPHVSGGNNSGGGQNNSNGGSNRDKNH
jgi:hypothetical protein